MADGWTATPPHAFADYTEAVVTRLGDRVDDVDHAQRTVRLVEPRLRHRRARSGPHLGRRGLRRGHHLLLAHGLAGQRIRSLAPDAELAIVLNFTPTEPASDHADDLRETRIVDDIENRWFVEPLTGHDYPDRDRT